MIRIIADSACDLTLQQTKNLPVDVVANPIHIDDDVFYDGPDFDLDRLIALLGSQGHNIRTRHVTPAAYEQAFLPYAEAGDSVICLCFSTGIASNLASAESAALSVKEKYPSFDISLLDSQCASAGYGLLVLRLADMAVSGASKEDILAEAEKCIGHVHHLFTLSVGDYFMNGGRISRVIGTVGDSLDVRPIFTLNEDGALSLIKPTHGSQHAIDAIISMMKDICSDFSDKTISLCYGTDLDGLHELESQIQEQLQPKEITARQISCAIATHSGQGILGVSFIH